MYGRIVIVSQPERLPQVHAAMGLQQPRPVFISAGASWRSLNGSHLVKRNPSLGPNQCRRPVSSMLVEKPSTFATSSGHSSE
jgi:hypothetical protein